MEYCQLLCAGPTPRKQEITEEEGIARKIRTETLECLKKRKDLPGDDRPKGRRNGQGRSTEMVNSATNDFKLEHYNLLYSCGHRLNENVW
ncbi:hypothetical protein RUM44_002996 [Polyplax serrata]|uniref:Uncharacterized protein n=1 Tax=Polyplax serrata TaxID=468196 RepID=A0ABR1AXA5_POLSC